MTKIISSKETDGKKIDVQYENGEWAFYFQFLGIGPQTMRANNFAPWGVPQEQVGYFISGNKEETKAFIHSLVDAAFKSLEEKQNVQS